MKSGQILLCELCNFAEFEFHVLAVDDSLIDRKLIERLLKTSSYQVTTVDSGSKALEFLGINNDDQRNPNKLPVSPYKHQEIEVNLVITDYCMPGMTGYDLLKKIKESASLRNIPVVIMSSENVPSRINRCLEEGAEEFLLKPVRLSDMNKLKPHLMKTKCKNVQKPAEEQEMQESTQVSSPETPLIETFEFRELKQQQQPQTQLDSNKRKLVDEGLSLSPERTKQRFNSLPVVSNL